MESLAAFPLMALTLYGAPRSRAALVRWYLEEKGIPCADVTIDLAAGEQKASAFLAINPFGKVPALVDDSVTLAEGQPLALFESGAILLHLAEHYGRESDSPAWRGLTAQWILFANATLGPAMVAASTRPQEIQRLLAALDPLLADGRSLLAPLGGAPSWARTAAGNPRGITPSRAVRTTVERRRCMAEGGRRRARREVVRSAR